MICINCMYRYNRLFGLYGVEKCPSVFTLDTIPLHYNFDSSASGKIKKNNVFLIYYNIESNIRRFKI